MKEIGIKLALDGAAKVQSQLKGVESSFGRLGDTASGMSTAFGLAGRAMAALGIGATVGELVRMADASTNVSSRLGLVTSSAAELASVQQSLFSIAQASRVNFVDLAGTYAQVARSTKDLGVSQTALLGVIQTISQAVTISGGSAASAQAALTQLSQGFASGALRGEELNSILEQTPRLAQALADGLGVGVGKLREMGQAGELTAQKVLGALQASAASVSEEFGKMAVTVEQASVNATNSMLKLVGAFDKLLGVTSALGGAIQTVSKGLDFISRDVEKMGTQGPLRDAAREVLNLNAAAERLRTGMQSGVLGPNAQGELDRINARLAEAKKRFRELDQQVGGAPSAYDNRPEDARLASGIREAERLAKLREDANTFRLGQAGVPVSYVKDMAELIRLNQAGVIVGKEYNDALKKQQDILLKKSGVTGAVAKEESAANKALQDQAKLLAELSGLSGSFAADWQMLTTAYQSGKLSLDGLTAAQAALLEKQPAIKAAADEEKKAQDLLTQSYQAAAAERLKIVTAMEQSAVSAAEQNQALRDEIELIGLTEEQQTRVLQMRNEAIILTKEATLAELERANAITGTMTREQIALAAEIEALKERNELLGAKSVKNASVEAAKKAEDEWKKTTDQINESLTDALMRGFESGKDFAKNMRDTVTNMFKTMVLRPIISAVMSPISGAINGALGGAAGGAVGSGIGSGIATSIGTSAIGSAFSLGLTNFGTGVGSTLANGIFGGIGTNISNFGTLAGAGNLSGALGVAAPYLAGIGAIYAIAKSLDDSGTYHTGGAAQYSATGGLTAGQSGTGYGLSFGRVEAGAETIAAVGTVAQSIGTALDAVAVSFGRKAGFEVAAAYAADSSDDREWADLRISQGGVDLANWGNNRDSKWAAREVANGAEGWKQFLGLAGKQMRDVLLGMDLPGWADTVLKAIGDSPSIEDLSAALTQIGQAQTVFKSFGQYMTTFATLADSSVTKLAAASGGIGALAGNMATFVDQFYTDAEKLAVNTENVREALGKLGFELPATRDEFKALVQAQLALGDAGAETAAGLLGLSGAFAAIVPAADAVTESVKAMTASLDDYISSNVRDSAQSRYLRGLEMVGNTAELKRLGIPGYASGGYHPGGARMVGERGREIEITGPSMILSNPITEAIMGRRGNDGAASAAVVDELRGLRSGLDNLRAEVRAVVVQTAKAADIWERVTPGRNSISIATPYGPVQVATPAGKPLSVDQVT